jgi:hypothetical protein
MASRKLTFTLPADLATQFLHRVPPSQRSHYVAAAIAAKLREREEQVIRACEVANQSADVLDIETAWDSLSDESDRVQEPW